MTEEIKKDVQNLKEVTVFTCKAIDAFLKAFKDGFQGDDVSFLLKQFASEEFTKTMKEAWDGISEIPEEMKDISIKEILELAGVVYTEFKD